MTSKKQAAEKVAKLRRLAERAGTPAEGVAATKAAEKLVAEWKLTEADLTIGAKAAAFEDLISQLDKFVRENQAALPGSVIIAVGQVKNIEDEDKAHALEKAVGIIRLGSMFFGHHKSVAAIRDVVDGVLKKHDVRM